MDLECFFCFFPKIMVETTISSKNIYAKLWDHLSSASITPLPMTSRGTNRTHNVNGVHGLGGAFEESAMLSLKASSTAY